jgi:hypothetical protein
MIGGTKSIGVDISDALEPSNRLYEWPLMLARESMVIAL